MPDNYQDDAMVAATYMYYADGLTQEQIALRLGLSRVKIARLLQRARTEGVVQFRLTRSLPLQYGLERQLETAFGLNRAMVVRTGRTRGETLAEMGQRGADYLRQILFPGCRLGVGWSTTVSHIARHFEPPRPRVKCFINELVGGYPGHTNPYSISVELAQLMEAPLEALPVPAFVQSAAARDAILKESVIRTALEHARHCDIALVGLGDVSPDGTMVNSGFMTAAQVETLRRRGAVGDILGRFYDGDGHRVETPFDERSIAIAWEDILRIKHLVVLAAGPSKVEPILGAFRGQFCHCLITDTETAQTLLVRGGPGPAP